MISPTFFIVVHFYVYLLNFSSNECFENIRVFVPHKYSKDKAIKGKKFRQTFRNLPENSIFDTRLYIPIQ